MITVIAGTNRPSSNTLKIAQEYVTALAGLGLEAQLLSLDHLPHDMLVSDFYGKRSAAFQEILERFIIPVQKFVAVVPEYNGSYPGVFKLLVDAVHPEHFRGKKIALVGVGAGRGGNARGLDDLTGVFHYLRMHVFFDKLPISRVRELVGAEGVKDETTKQLLRAHAQGFAAY